MIKIEQHARVVFPTAPDIVFPFRWIPPGDFIMGEPGMRETGDLPFRVTLTQGYWLGTYPVTHLQWMRTGGVAHATFESVRSMVPQTGMSWQEAVQFCQRLTADLGPMLPEGYRITLPTEAQWEYACRAGTTMLYHDGESYADLVAIGWFKDNSNGAIQEVAQKRPNPWGLYDMVGNVFEFCLDSISEYPTHAVVDWIGRSADVTFAPHRAVATRYHIIRGGGYRVSYAVVPMTISARADPICLADDQGDEGTGLRLCISQVS